MNNINREVLEIAARFAIEGEPVGLARHGGGHINATYKVETRVGRAYILQRVNDKIFTDVPALMRSITAVTEYLKRREGDPRRVLNVVPAADGKPYFCDDENGCWRVFDYITDSMALDTADSAGDTRESGAAFGLFRRDLEGFDVSKLYESIPRFHDTVYRYEQLNEAIKGDKAGRVKNVSGEIDFALRREEYAHTLIDAHNRGELPIRVTHNDTKLNNVLFDVNTRKALCVIDLDTVMPGLCACDFGDGIRTGASTAAEDERDLSKVSLSTEMYEAFAEGYMAGGDLTEAEVYYMRDGAKMMTLECGVRFLADYLNGDTYFHISRDGHNLDRARTQFKLVEEMERRWDELGGLQ